MKKALQKAWKPLALMLLFCCTLAFEACDGLGEVRVGCVSGILPGTNNRVFILCLSADEYARSGNTFGGFSYDNIIWTEVDDCSVCPSLDYQNL